MVVKLIGSVLVIVATTCIGRYFSTRERFRMENLKDMKKISILLRNDIKYSAAPMAEAFKRAAGANGGTYKDFFEEIADTLATNYGGTFENIWNKGVEEGLGHTALTHNDKLALKRLSDGVKYSDRQTQIDNLDYFISYLDMTTEEVSQKLNEKVRLYNLIGIASGIFIVLIAF